MIIKHFTSYSDVNCDKREKKDVQNRGLYSYNFYINLMRTD